MNEYIKQLQQKIKEGGIILGCGAGTGLSAKAVDGIADFIVIYNSGYYRMNGLGSLAGMLPFDDANKMVVKLGLQVLPVVEKTPVIAGVCAIHPHLKKPELMDMFLNHLKKMGFAGVQNYPTVGLYDGKFRQNLEESGFSYDLEVDMIKKAHQKGMMTCPYVFDAEQAIKMTQAGADIIVAHMGLTTGGTIGAKTSMKLDEAATLIQQIEKAVHKINPNAIVACHGGPIAEPKDFEYIRKNTHGVHGFWGASSIERLPTERAIKEQALQFRAKL